MASVVKTESFVVENLDVRRKAYTAWCNIYLNDRKLKVKSSKLTHGAFTDGILLANFVEVLSGRMLPRWNSKAKSRKQKIENVQLSMDFLHQCFYSTFSAEEIVDNDEEALFELFWNLIRFYTLKSPLKMNEIISEHVAWLQDIGLPVQTLAYDFQRNPLLMVIFVNIIRPGLMEDKYLKGDPYKGGRVALQVAESDLHVPHILEADDFFGVESDDSQDTLSMLIYLSYFKTLYVAKVPSSPRGKPRQDTETPELSSTASHAQNPSPSGRSGTLANSSAAPSPLVKPHSPKKSSSKKKEAKVTSKGKVKREKEEKEEKFEENEKEKEELKKESEEEVKEKKEETAEEKEEEEEEKQGNGEDEKVNRGREKAHHHHHHHLYHLYHPATSLAISISLTSH
eukprot:TRINITY_DN1418_c1_g1_i1.p1 TRINITY_DN1418_c1_g1~~TRINITY_DN1418_c1_g1_i1.p1  ORF type:complete len:444 (+),score=154.63 TRINITY_DN1418_c1_g1_i1:139-1332(+)